jgi:hypothetical protein
MGLRDPGTRGTYAALRAAAKRARGARAGVAFWAVCAWLALQMLALVAAGLRIPFSARFVVPEEQLAIHEMFAVQMIASALLFPILFRNLATAVTVIATVPLMVQMAGVLGAQSELGALIAACTYPMLWLIGLALWAYALRGAKGRLYGVAGATLVVVGGALAAYLDREFGAHVPSIDWGSRGWLGPLMGGIALMESGERTGTAWVFMGLHLMVAGVAASVRWRLEIRGAKARLILD